MNKVADRAICWAATAIVRRVPLTVLFRHAIGRALIVRSNFRGWQ